MGGPQLLVKELKGELNHVRTRGAAERLLQLCRLIDKFFLFRYTRTKNQQGG